MPPAAVNGPKVNTLARALARQYARGVEWMGLNVGEEDEWGDPARRGAKLSVALGPAGPAGAGTVHASLYLGTWLGGHSEFTVYVHVYVARTSVSGPFFMEVREEDVIAVSKAAGSAGKRKRGSTGSQEAYDTILFEQSDFRQTVPATGLRKTKLMMITTARGWAAPPLPPSLCASVLHQAVAEYNKNPVRSLYEQHQLRGESAARANLVVSAAVRRLHSSPQGSSIQTAKEISNLNDWAAAHPHVRGLVKAARRNPFNVEEGCSSASKLFARQPTKRNVEHMVSHWTTSDYRKLQTARRTGDLPTNVTNALTVQKLNMALALQMKKYALRAPAMPPKVRDVVTGSATPTLYRGLRLTPGQFAQLSTTGLRERGYTAFSRNPSLSTQFAGRPDMPGKPHTIGVLLRLSTANVESGTPWIWFTSETETLGKSPNNKMGSGQPFVTPMHYLPPGLRTPQNIPAVGQNWRRMPTQAVHKNFVQGAWEEEHEVLLPPGTLRSTGRLLANTKANARVTGQVLAFELHYVDVQFKPDKDAKSLWRPCPQPGNNQNLNLRQAIV